MAGAQGSWNDVLAEIGGFRVAIEQLKQRFPLKHINPHRSQKRPPQGFLLAQSQGAGVDPHGREGFAAGFFPELPDLPIVIGAHQPEASRRCGIHRQGRHRQRRTAGPVGLDEGLVIHAVELITGKDQQLIYIPRLNQLAVLAHSIRCALKPAWTVGGLLGRQHLDKAVAEARGEVVGEADVTVEGLTVELGERVDLVDPGIDAIADRYVDQAINAAQGNRRLGAGEGQGLQARAGAAAQDDGQYMLHALISRLRWK